MNNTATTNPASEINPFSQPLYPSISSPTATPEQQTHPFHQTPTNNSTTQESQPHPPPPPPPHLTSISDPKQKETEPCNYQTPTAPVPSSSSPKTQEEEFESGADKWGTHIMGHPAIPTSHPDNKKAALWGAAPDQAHVFHYPYVHYSPIEKSTSNSPMESILHVFNSWSNKAESMANNIWHNRKLSKPI